MPKVAKEPTPAEKQALIEKQNREKQLVLYQKMQVLWDFWRKARGRYYGLPATPSERVPSEYFKLFQKLLEYFDGRNDVACACMDALYADWPKLQKSIPGMAKFLSPQLILLDGYKEQLEIWVTKGPQQVDDKKDIGFFVTQKTESRRERRT